mmetsp:Transcript_26639/g.44555  ORF Transcript_26639/g.44555 Transcript_26639/m.44555 type:complete len:85 (+) Transcript_26639:231-485(+)
MASSVLSDAVKYSYYVASYYASPLFGMYDHNSIGQSCNFNSLDWSALSKNIEQDVATILTNARDILRRGMSRAFVKGVSTDMRM